MLMPIMLSSQWILEESFAFILMSNESNVTSWILFDCEWTIEQLSVAHSLKDNSCKREQCGLRLSRMPSVTKHNRAYLFVFRIVCVPTGVHWTESLLLTLSCVYINVFT